MANTYTQIHIHIVFAVQERRMLKRFNVPHDQRYIFQPVDPD